MREFLSEFLPKEANEGAVMNACMSRLSLSARPMLGAIKQRPRPLYTASASLQQAGQQRVFISHTIYKVVPSNSVAFLASVYVRIVSGL